MNAHTTPSTRTLLVLALATAAALAVPVDASAGDSPNANVVGKGAPSDVEVLEGRWREAPGEVERGLRYLDALLEAGRASDAVAVFRRHAQAAPGDPVAAFLVARAQGGKQGIDAMRRVLTRGLGSSDRDAAAAWHALSTAEEGAEMWEAALASAREAATRRPTAGAHAHVGRLLERMKRPKEAVEAYRVAVRTDPRHVRARNALALLLGRQGQGAEARAIVAETVKSFPESPEAHVTDGLLHVLAHEKDAALSSFERALELAGSHVPTLLVLASAYAELEQFPLAGKTVSRALLLAPEDARVRVVAGAVALEEGNAAAAQSHLEKAVRLAGGKDARTAYLLGTAYARQEEHAKAVRELARAVRLAPGVRAYAVSHALALEASGAVEGAITAYRDALELVPEDADLHLRLGALLQRKRKWRQAQVAFEKAADLRPSDPKPHFFLAVLLGDDLRKTSEALLHLETYVRLGGKEPTALRWLDELKKRRKDEK